MNIEDFSCFCEVRANAKVKIMLYCVVFNKLCLGGKYLHPTIFIQVVWYPPKT